MDQFAKGITAIMHQVTLLCTEVLLLQRLNEALSKRKRAKRTRLQDGGSLTIREASGLLDQKAVDAQLIEENRRGGVRMRGGLRKAPRCGMCGKPGHNSQTCREAIEASDSAMSSVIEVN